MSNKLIKFSVLLLTDGNLFFKYKLQDPKIVHSFKKNNIYFDVSRFLYDEEQLL